MAEKQQSKEKTEEEKKQERKESTGMIEVLKTSLLILALLGVVILLYFGALKYRAEMYHSDAVRSLNSRKVNLKEAQDLESRAINLISFEDRYRRVLSQIYLLRINKVMSSDTDQESKQSQFQSLMRKAVNQAQQAVKISNRNVANWINQGSVYQQLMDYGVQGADQWAEKSYQRAIELAPNNPAFHTQLARVYITKAGISAQGEKKEEAKSNLTKAEEHINKALNIKPNYWPAHFQQAVVYDQQGKLDQAIQTLENLKKAQPNDQNVLFRLGMLYWRQEKLEEAERELKSALEISSNFTNARYFFGLV